MPAKTSRRNTRQRRVILEELRRSTAHPTAAELHEIARERLPRLSLGTVYRNLELLTQIGLVRRMETSGAEARFDGNVDRHYHVCCVRCGRVDDAHGAPDDPVNGDIKTLAGYEILGFRLEFTGICPACNGRSVPAGKGVSPQGGEGGTEQDGRRGPSDAPA